MYVQIICLLSLAVFSHQLQGVAHCSFFVLKVLQVVEFVEKIARFVGHIVVFVAVVVECFAEQE